MLPLVEVCSNCTATLDSLGVRDPQMANRVRSRPVVRRGTVHMSRTRAQAGSRVVIQRPCSGTGSFHRLVQFIVTFDPSKVASLLVGGLPGESSELLKGHRSF